MFWRFGGYANISTLDSILDKPDVTLEELLDESDLIQELKAQNAKLIEFLREDAVLERLLAYVIAHKEDVLPESAGGDAPEHDASPASAGFFKSRVSDRSKSRDPADSDHDRQEQKRTKYAYVACEILSSEVYSIHESLLANPEYLKKFWHYISQPAPLDPVQAGYFTKVNEALLEKKTEDMIAFIKTVDNVVTDMMQHVDCPMIMDLLLKLISLEKEPEGQGVIDWLQTQDLVPMLLSYITPEHSAATQTSAGDFLKAIITISANATGQDASVIGPNELTRQLVSEPCISGLITEMLKGGNPLTVGVGIVIEVIRKNNSDYDSEAQIGPEPKSSDPIYLGTLLRYFADHISDFMALILSPKHTVATDSGIASVPRKDLKVAWGDKIEPLGFDRFKTCELMAELLHCSNMGLLNEKGSDAAVKARDAERERLKAQGKLASAQQNEEPQSEFGASIDSSGFHHAEEFTPLGESPENVKRLEVQNNADDEDFEKVPMPGVSGAPGDDSTAEDTSTLKDKSTIEGVTGSLADLELESVETTSDQPSSQSHPPRTSSKQPISLLSQQIQASQDDGLKGKAGLNAPMPSEDTPAPLFSSRSESQTGTIQGEPATTETMGGPGPDTPTGESSSVDPQNLPIIEREEDGSSVIGDLLKVQFVEHHVVPTILDFFFRFPWNNFLHNVVYDVVQQVFNGSMDRGFNRNLAIDLFETGRITDRVIEGQQRSDKAQADKGMRLGYMGHLTLIAEEVVKFTERQPAELLASVVVDKVTSSEWINYVDHTLTETRDRDNAILGGVRPDVAGGPRQAVLNAVNAAQTGLGGNGSNALANAGLGGADSAGLDSMDLANASGSTFGLGGNGSLLSGFGSSDDEDEDDMEISSPPKAGGSSQPQENEEDNSTAQLASTSEETSTSPPTPAPLAIPPSRARRQLAARLAEKKRLADKDQGTSSGAIDSDGEEDLPSVTTGLAQVTLAATVPASSAAQTLNVAKPSEDTGSSDEEDDDAPPARPLARTSSTHTLSKAHLMQAQDPAADNSDDSDESDDSDDGPHFAQSQRHNIRTVAPSQRRPLDDVSSSSSSADDEESEDDEARTPTGPKPKGKHRQAGEEENDDEEEGELDITLDDGLDVEDYWRLGELRQAQAERTALAASSSGAPPSLASPTSAGAAVTSAASTSASASAHWRAKGSRGSLGTRDPRLAAGGDAHAHGHAPSPAQAKQREQNRLLAQWGLPSRGSGAGDDEPDEDERPVEIGSKYLSRRASLGRDRGGGPSA